MFWATMCPSSGETTVFIQPCYSVRMTVWYAGWNETLHTTESSVQNNKYQVSHKHSCFSWWWPQSRPKHVEKRNKHTKKNCAPSWFYLQDNKNCCLFLWYLTVPETCTNIICRLPHLHKLSNLTPVWHLTLSFLYLPLSILLLHLQSHGTFTQSLHLHTYHSFFKSSLPIQLFVQNWISPWMPLSYHFCCVYSPNTVTPCPCLIIIQGVTGGTDQTSGECSLGQTIPI